MKKIFYTKIKKDQKNPNQLYIRDGISRLTSHVQNCTGYHHKDIYIYVVYNVVVYIAKV